MGKNDVGLPLANDARDHPAVLDRRQHFAIVDVENLPLDS
jgi:hypothetical protein